MAFTTHGMALLCQALYILTTSLDRGTYPHLTGEQAETSKCEVKCPRSHRLHVAEPRGHTQAPS